MDPPGQVGLGLKTQSPAPYMSETILSTAPASPTEALASRHGDESNTTMITKTTSSSLLSPHSTMAQLSFGPATQQTVTTVTTTTTVSLPPLIIKPPRNLHDRDPKQYPLAFSPTPHHIKRFCFDVNNQPTVFSEAEDAEETARHHRQLLDKIQEHNGALRQELRDASFGTPVSRSSKHTQGVRASHAQKRTASPPSLAEAVELASLQRKAKKQRSHLHRTYSEASEGPSLNERAAADMLAGPSNPSPLTPDTDAVGGGSKDASARGIGQKSKVIRRRPQSRLHQLQLDDETVQLGDIDSQEEEDSQMGPPFYSRKKNAAYRYEDGGATSDPDALLGATPTPPTIDAAMDTEFASEEASQQRNRPAFPNLLTGSQQDASLPSPSLSPITAAANLASRQNTFETSFADHVEEGASVTSGYDMDEEPKTQSTNSSGSQLFEDGRRLAVPQRNIGSGLTQYSSRPGPTIMDIPTMVDAFDNMPEAMQTYMMYQLLRRCAKPTLQMVAAVVNPALKCDPFNVLPPELGLNITRFLDAQSMCRAAQVSKRWRRLINSDEKAWKDLLDRDEFVLPEGEIARAVREGWGWQIPGKDGFEEDLSLPLSHASPEPTETSIFSDDELTASSAVNSRAAKKIMKVSSSKKAKRRTGQASSSVTKPVPTLQMRAKVTRMLEAAKGASSYAQVATQAVPHPTVGLESLRNMHLFKSLYQRHYLIRKAWMSEDSQPKHLAFRAHHRHVVTCLLFDSDKILTGSDDTKINVYDTKTGALRTRLEGHEGGVWALQYEGNTLVSGSTDRSVRVWNIEAGTCLQIFQGHTSTVRCLVILKPVQIGTEADGTPIMMPKEPLIITGSRDSTLRVWKLPGPKDPKIFQAGPPANDRDNPYFLRTLSGHHNSVRAIAAHGDTLVSGSYDCTVRVWKISTGDLVHRLQGHTQKVYSVVLDHQRNRCISGSMDNFVKVWDLQTGANLFNLEGHTSLVGLLDLSHDRLVSAAADSTLRIWDPETGTPKATLSAHTGAITCFQHDGQKVVSGSDRTLKMWNVKNGECVRDLLTELSGVWQVRFDERRCVAAVQRNNLTYIEVSLSSMIKTYLCTGY